jgi:hypothetical protein
MTLANEVCDELLAGLRKCSRGNSRAINGFEYRIKLVVEHLEHCPDCSGSKELIRMATQMERTHRNSVLDPTGSR